MNLLFLASKEHEKDAQKIMQQLRDQDHLVYPSYDLNHDDRYMMLPTYAGEKGQQILYLHLLREALLCDRGNYFRQLLTLPEEDAVEGVVFYHPSETGRRSPLSQEEQLHLLLLFKKNVPVYLYQDNVNVHVLANEVGCGTLVKTINGDLRQIQSKQK